jgi:outer membrane murein-binding lipoprotein Lpp
LNYLTLKLCLKIMRIKNMILASVFGLLWLSGCSNVTPQTSELSALISEVAKTVPHENLQVDPMTNVRFTYDAPLPFNYIDVQEWPPAVNFLSEPKACQSGGSVDQENGKTEVVTLAGTVFCVETIREEVGGNVYTTTNYTAEKDNRIVSIDLAVKYLACGNYEDAQKLLCVNERTAFDPQMYLTKIWQTLEI